MELWGAIALSFYVWLRLKSIGGLDVGGCTGERLPILRSLLLFHLTDDC